MVAAYCEKVVISSVLLTLSEFCHRLFLTTTSQICLFPLDLTLCGKSMNARNPGAAVFT